MTDWESNDAILAQMARRLLGEPYPSRKRYVPIKRAKHQPAIGMDPLNAVDRIQIAKPVGKIVLPIAQPFSLSTEVPSLATGPDH
jgi:hypothetical protein